VTVTLLPPRTDDAEVRAPLEQCARCECARFEGDGRFCEGCGHRRADHPTVAVQLIAAACTRCECLIFRGHADALHCTACGHPRELHSLEHPEPPATPVDDGWWPGRDRDVWVLAAGGALSAGLGGALIGYAMSFL
jgi:hypothetical protein